MAIYALDGTELSSAYDIDGNELANAYDINGNLVFSKSTPERDPYIEGRTLIWEDDFDGTKLNENEWVIELGDLRNNELQTFTRKSVAVENSCLVLTAKKEDFGTKHWTSGSITSDKNQFQYGRFEAKCRVQNIEGAFPAFWLLGATFDIEYQEIGKPTYYNKTAMWAECGEIDIFEYTYQNRTKAKATVFTNTGAFLGGSQKLSATVNSEEWHIYACEWTPDNISIYLDGVKYAEWNLANYSAEAVYAYKNYPFRILLDLAVGGLGGGTPAESTTEMKMYVDWVRVYAPLEVQS